MKLSFMIHTQNNRMGLVKTVDKIMRTYKAHQVEMLIGDTSSESYSATSKKWLSNEFFASDINIVYRNRSGDMKYEVMGSCARLARGELLMFRSDDDEYYEEHVCTKIAAGMDRALAFNYVAEGKERAPKNHRRPIESCVFPRQLITNYLNREWHKNTDRDMLKLLYAQSSVIHCDETMLYPSTARRAKLDMVG